MRNSVPHNLTRQEFEKLACREPSTEGNWIYQLEQAFFDSEMKLIYPKFKLCYPEKRLFLSLEKAIEYLGNNSNEDLYCSWITQIPEGKNEYKHGARWFFDAEGNLLDYAVTYSFGDDLNATFFGRPRSRQRFSKGDIVEVVYPEEVRLAVVGAEQLDVEYCWRIYERCQTQKNSSESNEDCIPYILDITDDSVTVLDGPSYVFHDHISPLHLQKPRFEIPEDIKVEMMTWLERAEKESDCRKGNSSLRTEKSKTIGQDDFLSRFYHFNLFLKFEDNGELLLLIDDNYGLRVSLRIESPEYADYKDFTGRLSDSQLKALQNYLEEYDQGKPRWWYLLRDWNEDENHRIVSMATPLPDYTLLISNQKLKW